MWKAFIGVCDMFSSKLHFSESLPKWYWYILDNMVHKPLTQNMFSDTSSNMWYEQQCKVISCFVFAISTLDYINFTEINSLFLNTSNSNWYLK